MDYLQNINPTADVIVLEGMCNIQNSPVASFQFTPSTQEIPCETINTEKNGCEKIQFASQNLEWKLITILLVLNYVEEFLAFTTCWIHLRNRTFFQIYYLRKRRNSPFDNVLESYNRPHLSYFFRGGSSNFCDQFPPKLICP